MATEVGSAFVTILPSARGFGRALNRQVGPAVADAGTSSGRRFASGFNAAGLGALKTGVFAGVTAGLAGIGAAASYGVKIAAQNEQAQISFETMLGSASKAQKFLGDLQKFAAATPFEFPELQTAASRLISVGVNADKVIPIMTTLGDITSGMGTGSEGVQRATNALQQMSAAGRISAEDLNQLRDAGVPVFELLAKATGKSTAQLVAMKDAGELGKKELGQLFKALETGKGLERFTGLMEKQSHSLSGLLSTFKDTLGQGLARAITPSLPVLKTALTAVTNFVGTAVNGVSQFATIIGPILKRFGPEIGGALAAIAGVAGAAGTFILLASAIGAVLSPIGLIAGGAGLLGAAFVRAYRRSAPFRRFIGGIGRTIRTDVLPALATLRDTLKGYGERISRALGSIDLSGGGELSAASFVAGLQAKLAGIDWGQVGVTVGTGIADALNAAGSVAARLTVAFTGLIDHVNWGDVAFAVGKQGLTIALGLVTGLLNVDMGSLFRFVADHWLAVLVGILTILFAPTKIFAFIGRTPLVGPLIERLLLGFRGAVRPVVDAVGGFLGRIAGAFFDGMASLFPRVGASFFAHLRNLPTYIRVLASEFLDHIAAMWNQVEIGLGAGAFQVGRGIMRVIRAIGGALLRGLDATAGRAFRGAFGIVSRLAGGIASGVGRAVGAVGRVSASVASATARGLGRAAVAAARGAVGLHQRLVGAITSGAPRALGAINRLTGGVAGRVASGLASAGRTAASHAASIVTAIARAIGSGVSAVAGAVARIGGAIKAAAAGFGDLLVSAGEDLVRGFIRGVGNMAGAAADAARNMASSAVESAKNLLHISSPSRVFMQLGAYVSEGFAIGIRQSATSAERAAAHLATLTREAVAGRGRGITAFVATENRALGRLADQRATVITRLAAATKSFATIQKQAAEAGATLRSGILDTANITQAPSGGAEGIRAQLAGALNAARTFTSNLRTLQRRGLNRTALQQLVDAGVQTGSGAATALVNASARDFAAINKLQGQLAGTAKAAGATATSALYDAGRAAALGLVRGLTSQKRAIERNMLTIANTMKSAIRKALGIHSPSRVFQAFGAAVADGLALGIAGGAGKVGGATRSLAAAATFTPSSVPRFGSIPAAGAGGGATYVRVQIGERDLTDIVRIEQDRRDNAFADGLTYRAA